jgi:hypothetical protein
MEQDINQLFDKIEQQKAAIGDSNTPSTQDEWITKLRAEAGLAPHTPQPSVPVSSPVPWNNGDLQRMLPESQYPVDPNVPVTPYQYTPPKGSAFDEALLGLNSGMQQIARVPNAAIAMGGNLVKQLGAEKVGQSIQDFGRTGMDYWQPGPESAPRIGKIEDVQSAKDLIDYLAYAGGQFAPQVALAYATGGAGALGGRAIAQRMIPEAFGKLAMPVERAIAETAARKMVTQGAMVGTGLGSTAMETEQIASMQLAKNKELDAIRALPFAVLAGATEIIPVFSLLKRTGIGSKILTNMGVGSAEQAMRTPGFISLVKEGAMGFVKQGTVGGTQEITQTVLERAGVKGLSLTDAEAMSDYLNAGVTGFGLEGLTGGAGGMFKPVQPQFNQQKGGAALTDVIRNIHQGQQTQEAAPVVKSGGNGSGGGIDLTAPLGSNLTPEQTKYLNITEQAKEAGPEVLQPTGSPNDMLPVQTQATGDFDSEGNRINKNAGTIQMAAAQPDTIAGPEGVIEQIVQDKDNALSSSGPAVNIIEADSTKKQVFSEPAVDTAGPSVATGNVASTQGPIDLAAKTPQEKMPPKMGELVNRATEAAKTIEDNTSLNADVNPFTGEMVVNDPGKKMNLFRQDGKPYSHDGQNWIIPPSEISKLIPHLMKDYSLPDTSKGLINAAKDALGREELPQGTPVANTPESISTASGISAAPVISSAPGELALNPAIHSLGGFVPAASTDVAHTPELMGSTIEATQRAADNLAQAALPAVDAVEDRGQLAVRKAPSTLGPIEGAVQGEGKSLTAVTLRMKNDLVELLGAGDKDAAGNIISERPESRGDIGLRRQQGNVWGDTKKVPGHSVKEVIRLGTYTPEVRGILEPIKKIMSQGETFWSSGRTAYRFNADNHYDANADVLNLWKKTRDIIAPNPHINAGVVFSNLVKNQGYAGYVFNAEPTGQERWSATFSPVTIEKNLGVKTKKK